nr:hypothetical protein CFP56_48756 [Quercus suber]
MFCYTLCNGKHGLAPRCHRFIIVTQENQSWYMTSIGLSDQGVSSVRWDSRHYHETYDTVYSHLSLPKDQHDQSRLQCPCGSESSGNTGQKAHRESSPISDRPQRSAWPNLLRLNTFAKALLTSLTAPDTTMTINKPSMKEPQTTGIGRCEDDHGKTSTSIADRIRCGKATTSRRRSPSPFAIHPLREHPTIHTCLHHGNDGEIVGVEYWASPTDELYQDCRTYFPRSDMRVSQDDRKHSDPYLRVTGTSDEALRAAEGRNENKLLAETDAWNSTKQDPKSAIQAANCAWDIASVGEALVYLALPLKMLSIENCGCGTPHEHQDGPQGLCGDPDFRA